MIQWQREALRHAEWTSPEECCGFLIREDGEARYVPAKNVATSPCRDFEIDAPDWIKAEKRGEIIAIIHSHPWTPPVASEHDRFASDKLGLPYWIVHPSSGRWGYYEPTKGPVPLIGRPWVWKRSDCWTLVRDYYEETAGIILRDWERPASLAEFNSAPMFDSCFRATGFRELHFSEELQEHDCLLMSLGTDELSHIAVYIGDQMILHHVAGRLSGRESYGEFYQKITGRRLRHENY